MMTRQKQKEALSRLEQEFIKNGYEAFIDEQDTVSLKALINLLGKDELGAAIFELSFLEDESLQALKDIEVAQFFVTFDKKVHMEKLPEILCAMNKINLISAIGSFQIFEEEAQLFFKYNCLINKDKDEVLSVIPVINWIIAMLEDCYDDITALITGEF